MSQKVFFIMLFIRLSIVSIYKYYIQYRKEYYKFNTECLEQCIERRI